MTTKASTHRPKRIAVAIEIGAPMSHHQSCYQGILKYVREHQPGWQIVVDPFLVGLGEHRGVGEYDGIVGRIDKEPADRARELGIPVVNHWLNSPADNLPAVYTDYQASGRIVAEHFIERGYRRLGMISWETDRARKHYLTGLTQVAEAHGLPVQTLDAPYDFMLDPDLFTTFYKQLRETLQGLKPPIGLFTPMDSVAVYLVQLCNEMGLRVPHDVGLAVSYNALTLCLNTRPTLTAIEANDERVGYEAMQLLDRLMSGQPAPEQPLWIEPKSLRVRGSSEVFVSGDPVVSKAMLFIADNARKPITVEDVAIYAGVSKRTLSRRFDEHVGTSVHNEISRIRSQIIMQVLVDTDLPISEVASSCGFASTSHFNVFFRKAVGQTPGEYRKKQRAAS